MFKIEDKYKKIYIDGINTDIDKIDIIKMDECLKKLEEKRMEIIEQQNEYLSQILDEK